MKNNNFNALLSEKQINEVIGGSIKSKLNPFNWSTPVKAIVGTVVLVTFTIVVGLTVHHYWPIKKQEELELEQDNPLLWDKRYEHVAYSSDGTFDIDVKYNGQVYTVIYDANCTPDDEAYGSKKWGFRQYGSNKNLPTKVEDVPGLLNALDKQVAPIVNKHSQKGDKSVKFNNPSSSPKYGIGQEIKIAATEVTTPDDRHVIVHEYAGSLPEFKDKAVPSNRYGSPIILLDSTTQ